MQPTKRTAPPVLKNPHPTRDLEREHNARERQRGSTGTEPVANPGDTVEPWPEYDVDLMPRGV